ncbi:MAG: hypothetical protein IJI16_03505 [Atopobiaceae bacterium]|nr:hypothetical protein [Atopobiaceae bacterium]
MRFENNFKKNLFVDITVSDGVQLRNIKDDNGNTMTTTFIPASGEGENANPGSTISFNAMKKLEENELTPASKTFTISTEATYRAKGGVKTTGSTTGAEYVKFVDDKDNPLTVYIEGDFAFAFTGTYKGDLNFDNVTFERNGETQTGNFTLEGATTTFSDVTFTVKNGRIAVRGDVELLKDERGGIFTLKGNDIEFMAGDFTMACINENSSIVVAGGTAKPTTKPAKSETTSLGVAASVSVIDHDSSAYVSENVDVGLYSAAPSNKDLYYMIKALQSSSTPGDTPIIVGP